VGDGLADQRIGFRHSGAILSLDVGQVNEAGCEAGCYCYELIQDGDVGAFPG
jgi:hypothetical protein